MEQQHDSGDEDDEKNTDNESENSVDDQESDNDSESSGSDDTQTTNQCGEDEGYSFEDVQAILRYFSECNNK